MSVEGVSLHGSADCSQSAAACERYACRQTLWPWCQCAQTLAHACVSVARHAHDGSYTCEVSGTVWCWHRTIIAEYARSLATASSGRKTCSRNIRRLHIQVGLAVLLQRQRKRSPLPNMESARRSMEVARSLAKRSLAWTPAPLAVSTDYFKYDLDTDAYDYSLIPQQSPRLPAALPHLPRVEVNASRPSAARMRYILVL